MEDLQNELPRSQTLGSRPLREIQQTKSDRSNPIGFHYQRSQQKHRARGVRGMADNNTEKRGRGRPRGGGARGGRGRAGDPRSVVGPSSTDKPKAVPGEDISGEGEPFVNLPPTLVLRPPESLSSPSRTFSTRSPTRSKVAPAVVKRSQLAFMTPAIRFVNHDIATDRGGLPLLVESLWANHMFPTLNRSDYIPPGLRASLPSLDRRYIC
jgi:hypothetical protein